MGGEWQTVFEKLGYLKDGRPTHAAMLLFGKNDPPYALHIGRFKIKVAFEITSAFERQEIYEYPLPALRELLLNAVVHRDYPARLISRSRYLTMRSLFSTQESFLVI